jgi:hypothetical protein
MHVSPGGYTVAEYCKQMNSNAIVVDKNYQRSDKVWPVAARSYLIDTLLQGYPIPKISLHQTTDLKSKKTVNYIVDGQQRSGAILDFFEDRFRLTGRAKHAGNKLSELPDELQEAFLQYHLTADVFVGATTEEIREVFRRINSYTVPLNHQEKRHARYQGEFKWFVLELCEDFTQSVKNMGVLTERQIVRMGDGELFTSLINALLAGIETHSQSKLDKLYQQYEASFPKAKEVKKRFNETISQLLLWKPIHDTVLMKLSNFFTLFLAVTHSLRPLTHLGVTHKSSKTRKFDDSFIIPNLTQLAEAIEAEEPRTKFLAFKKASESGTNTKEHRMTRFIWFCKALESSQL